MVSLNFFFYIFVMVFGAIGAIRGLRKELVVVVSGILALFIIQEVLPRLFGDMSGTKALTLSLIVIFMCGFFGYQTPAFRRFSESGRFERDAPIDLILGAVIGGFNGYLLVGSAWFFIAKAGYPFSWIIPPDAATESGKHAIELLQNMIPRLLTGNGLYVAIAIAVLIMIGVMI